MKVLVTGSSGFVGRNLVALLKSRQIEVKRLDKADRGKESDIVYRLGSFEHFEIIRKEIEDCDVIVHLAAESHVDRSITGPAEFVDNNVKGTLELLEMVRHNPKLQRLVLFSTDEVGACLDEGEFLEDSPIRPQNTYAATKAAQEHLAASYMKAFGVPVVTTRCVNIFGKFQSSEKFLPKIIENALKGQKIPVYGHGEQIREWVHVDHVCECVQYVAQATFIPPGAVVHITGSHGIQNLMFASTVLGILGKTPELIQFVTDRPGHDERYALGSTNNWGMTEYDRRLFMSHLVQTVDWYSKELSGEPLKWLPRETEKQESNETCGAV